MIALLVGTALALVALAFVLYPLFGETPRSAAVLPPPSTASGASLPSAAEQAVAALREVEFDRATGKLSESDYAVLKARYTREALAAMRAAAPAGASVSDAEVEAVILTYRARTHACPTCGPRPEADAVYCSSCGRYLAGKCGRCGSDVTEPAARFCTACGAGLAA
ncbi:MAG: zinc ribbon domain-containing protein [Gemmatimonadaceae bacterium]|nr:zinc ribbon domain-containing protein [Gemmatimonadaceae bacterium]